MKYPLNQIFYGPPGTGKTYSVAKLAEEIVNLSDSSSAAVLLTDIEKFSRILNLIREKFQGEEFKAKSNSIYRNDHAIMWTLGYLVESNNLGEPVLNKTDAINRGLKKSSSYWAQVSQYISQFGLVENWRDSSNLELNTQGVSLRDSISVIYSPEELKNWDKESPQLVRDFYFEILKNFKLNDFTPVVKMVFGALFMALNGELYKQNNEQRSASDEERINAEKYFDLPENIKDIKWIGHIARALDGLGIVELNGTLIKEKNYYKLTNFGNDLIGKIIENWEKNHPNIFKKILNFDDAIELGLINFITFHQSYSYEEFIEGLKPVVQEDGTLTYEIVDGIFKNICKKAISYPTQNYVLIIDEINRGNISKIFGELITLVETSKRLFQIPKENPQSSILPYSRVKFSVPNNIYILGTMNSADKSITSIDSALRRRFNFIEVPPNPSLLESFTYKDLNINLSSILSILNERIEYLLDRDHQIGHSYFMHINEWADLCRIFHQNIIPTLQDYFFNDWKKIAMVLGDTSNFDKSENEKFLTQKITTYHNLFLEEDEGEDNVRYEINPILVARKYDQFPIEAFIKSFV
jgi:hypothetical protein